MPANTCEFCSEAFEISSDDLHFYKRVDVPLPRFCPADRQRRRAAFRNERHLYSRTCDATKKKIISMYSPDKSFKIYDQDYFWSDAWDAADYGQSFDFRRPFFEQFRELQLQVPRISLFNAASENSYYTTHSAYNKNCYLGVDLGECEDVLYSNWLTKCKDCVDCSYSHHCELCYNTLYCTNCYNCDFCSKCEQCFDCFYCDDCQTCKYCFGCVGLRGKEYYLYNEPVGKERFFEHLAAHQYLFTKQQRALQELKKIRLTVPHRFAHVIQCENCTGDYLFQSKNAYFAYDSVRLWDCKYMYECLDCKDAYDCYQPGLLDAELIYEIHAGQGQKNSRFLNVCRQVSECNYCDYCFESKNLFGCVSLRRKEYCILNKQYSEAAYKDLLPRVIAHLKSTGEWGEFFPFWCSPFGYNESKAQDFSPMTEKEAASKNLPWCTYEIPAASGKLLTPPDDIRAVTDEITTGLIACEQTLRPFKITAAELTFYKRKNLPIPRLSFEARYRQRMSQRNPQLLWERECDSCHAQLQSTFAPDRPERILCEQCYHQDRYG